MQFIFVIYLNALNFKEFNEVLLVLLMLPYWNVGELYNAVLIRNARENNAIIACFAREKNRSMFKMYAYNC